jgi:hypothetical protein
VGLGGLLYKHGLWARRRSRPSASRGIVSTRAPGARSLVGWESVTPKSGAAGSDRVMTRLGPPARLIASARTPLRLPLTRLPHWDPGPLQHLGRSISGHHNRVGHSSSFLVAASAWPRTATSACSLCAVSCSIDRACRRFPAHLRAGSTEPAGSELMLASARPSRVTAVATAAAPRPRRIWARLGSPIRQLYPRHAPGTRLADDDERLRNSRAVQVTPRGLSSWSQAVSIGRC